MALEDVTKAARELAALRHAVNEAQQRRDIAIRQAFAAGVPIAVIARAANLTRARVSSILGHPFERVGRPPRTTPSG
jgi:hypothetical protein